MFYISHEELSRAQGAVRGTLVLSQEDTGSRMSRIGKSELVYGEIMTFDQILKAVADVSSADIRALADQILHAAPTLAVVGPFSKRSVFERVLK
jgi:predicted Zn-dependent peptidase